MTTPDEEGDHVPDCLLIFGGTFDPPHRAHVMLPRLAADHLGCSRVLHVPAAMNPLKESGPETSDEDRLAMLRLALSGIEGAEISTCEIDRGGHSYFIETLSHLRSPTPRETGLRFLIGADQVFLFHQWKDWGGILDLADPAVLCRPPWDVDTLPDALRSSFDSREAEFWLRAVVSTPMIDLAASEIRRDLRDNGSRPMLRPGLPEDAVDPKVLAYIHQRGLYREETG